MIIKVLFLFLFSDVYLFAAENVSPDIGTFLWRVATFIVFVIIIYKLAKTPILETLDRRKINIIKKFDSISQDNASVDKLLTVENDKLLHLDSELEELKLKYYKQIEIEKEHLIKECEQELKKYRTSIERTIEGEQKKIITILLDNVLKSTINESVEILQNIKDEKQLALSWRKNIGWLNKIER